jgi:glycosyltransferase involved in cell wall biosynthesis
MVNPLVTVIVPSYNQADYLEEALLSVFEQDFKKWECLIIDDGSSDHTRVISQKWIKKDRRFVYFYQENMGLSSARNYGLSRARGTYVQFLDADDFLNEKKLIFSIFQFEENESVDIVITNYQIFDQYTKTFTQPHFPLQKKLLNTDGILFNWDRDFAIPIHAALFRIDLFNEFKFPEDLRAKEDWVMWVKLFKNSIKIEYIDKVLAFYRRHSFNMTINKNMTQDIMCALAKIKPYLDVEEYVKLLELRLQRETDANFRLKLQIKKLKQNIGFKFYNKLNRYFKI